MYVTIYMEDKMKFKEMEDKSLEQIRYNPYTVGIHKEKKKENVLRLKK